MKVKDPDSLGREALVEIARYAQGFLFLDIVDDADVWTLDKDVSGADFVDHMISILSKHRLAPDDTAERIALLVAGNCTRQEDLDDLVHDVASKRASAINNGGPQEQAEFLLEHLSVKDIRAELGIREDELYSS